MLGLKYAHVVLLFLITLSVNAHGGIVYIHRERNTSIDISCESTNKEGEPFAFSLKRVLLQTRQGRDIDVYQCEFYYGSLPHDKNIPGKMEFFIYVEGFSQDPLAPCDCLSYPLLLYVISGAACLLAVLVFTLATVYCCKRPNRRKTQPVVPVYEEMTGVRPAKRKATSCQNDIAKLEEANSSVATLLSKENLYVN